MATSSRKTPRPWKIIFLLIPLVLLGALFSYFHCLNHDDPDNILWQGITQILLSVWITILLFLLVTAIFGITNYKKGFLNFLIGDNGTYSLSRLQAVLWAIAIISYQFSLIISIICNYHGNSFRVYQPTFSESAIWLLSLSLTSYIAVKGITVNSLSNNPNAFKEHKTSPKWGDILVGPNGLDFSKCQMLIWTILAIVVFESKVYYYNCEIIKSPKKAIVELSSHMYDEYSSKNSPDDPQPYVPYLPWSFVVLMGLSQGAYVGKKLVPAFKLDDMKTDKQTELQNQIDQLQFKTTYLAKITSAGKTDSNSKIDRAAIQSLKASTEETKNRIDELTNDLNQISKLLNR